MVITITPTGGGTAVTLIDGPDRAVDKTSGPTALAGSLSTDAQLRKAVRKAFAAPLQRGGSAGNHTFSGVRQCTSQSAARIWLFGHLAACPKGGTLNLTETGATATISDCVLLSIAYRWQGVSVFLDYTFTGGTVATSA